MTQPRHAPHDSHVIPSFQKLDVYQRSVELIDGEQYDRGVEPLERVVAMLTKLIDPDRQGEAITPTLSFPFTCTATVTGPITITATITATPR